MISRRTGYILVIVGSALCACTGVLCKAAIDGGVAPLELAAFRSYGAGLILLPFLLLSVRRLSRRDLVPILLFALIGIVLAQGLYYQAISRMDIAVALVIVYTGPLLVAAYQRIFHTERLPVVAYIAMFFAVGGVAIAVLCLIFPTTAAPARRSISRVRVRAARIVQAPSARSKTYRC